MADILLRFLHISDTHYAPPDYERPPSRFDPLTGFRALIDQLNQLPYQPDFILHSGDVAYDPYPDIYDEIHKLLSDLSAPLIVIPGNHDHSATLQTVIMGQPEPRVPFYYETERNGVRILCLDTNGPDATPPRGQVTSQQLAWLTERIATPDPRPILVFMHHPIIKTHTSDWYDAFMLTINGEDVHAALRPAADRIRGIFFGHVHQHISFYRDGLLYSAVKSSWTQFHTHPGQDMQTHNHMAADPGYALVTISTEGTFIQRFTYRVDDV
jgi:3',5'-cyclic-AMP phosphodiesterase